MSPKCSYCSSSKATVYCPADSAYLCSSCDMSIHSANKLSRRHVRQPVSPTPPSSSTDPLIESSDSWTPSPQLRQNQKASTSQPKGNGNTNDWSAISLEMIANVCVRREAEALSESSGFVVPQSYLKERYSVKNGGKKDESQQQQQNASDEHAKLERQKALSRLKSKRERASRTPQSKIRYECRKQLADSRPRVKGRFVSSKHDINIDNLEQ